MALLLMPSGYPEDDVPWATIREKVCSGEWKMKEVCKRFGLPMSTVASRANREDWPTPVRVAKRIRAANKGAPKRAEQLIEETLAGLQQKTDCIQGTASELAQSLEREQWRHREAIVRLTSDKISKSRVPAPKTWRDLDIADRINRRNLDLDKKEAEKSVQIGVFGSGVVDLNSSDD